MYHKVISIYGSGNIYERNEHIQISDTALLLRHLQWIRKLLRNIQE